MKPKINTVFIIMLLSMFITSTQSYCAMRQSGITNTQDLNGNNDISERNIQSNSTTDQSSIDVINNKDGTKETLQPTTEHKITITGDKMSFQQKNDGNFFDLFGNVKVILPIGELTSEELHIVTVSKIEDLSFNCIQSLRADNNVKLILDQRTCTADHLNITPNENLLHLIGNVKVIDSMATVAGEEIRVNYITRAIEILKASNQKKQVSFEINSSNMDSLPLFLNQNQTSEKNIPATQNISEKVNS